MRKNGFFSLVYHAIFISFILAPLVVVVLVSFTSKGYISMPFEEGFSLRWFRSAWESTGLVRSLQLSILVGLASATVAVGLAVPAALALTRYQFAGRNALMGFFLSPLMIPHVVLGVAFLRFFAAINISVTFFWLSATHVIVILPYALRLVLASATGMDRDAERAALSLGASRFTAFRRIVLPLILPGIAGGWILAFIQSFDELTMTIFVATPGTTTLPVAMYNQITQTIDPMIAAVSTVVIIGTLLLMVILDRIIGLDRVLIGKG